ncbi:hypothetical protein SUGI_0205220 [Cryptomeria japonica]|uniref:probable disease resistance RPP8-like protein 4 n=1 Tax=Cryptomeria japonica TaxID=3369 RepID=UPI002408ADC5|nr:probable disease resistance RPP8-like protein 4 [Cryptomeria japonica]GLJ13104.1 hypothetical protein SUGI_0205220 [Cryptomeria japonica]
MASVIGEAIAAKVCETAVDMAVQQLSKQIGLVINFQEDFEWLKDELKFMKGFLKDADQQCVQKETVKQWLHHVRDVALLAEDIFELCTVQPLYSSRHLFVLTGNRLVFRYKMARKISKVKDRINFLIGKGRQLKISHDVLSGEGASDSTFQRADWKRSSIVPVDSHPVGIEAKVEDIVSLLEKPEVSVICVVGMGGVGKTYLLQHVYSVVKNSFEKSIWLSISQSFSIPKLQHDLAWHLGLRKEIVDGDVTEQLAAQLINAHLKENKCLIVLDDVWKPIMEGNLIEKLGLTIDNNCKIVITTRNREVCRNVEAEIYQLECLCEDDSWNLFCIYGFPKCKENRPPEHLVDVARNIVKECGNLPLAIKATAASLASTTLKREWEPKFRQLQKVSTLNNPMEVLKLSYDCLPPHLRACFAYFSFFPGNENIECEYLVNLWMGEGFIPEGDEQWDVGWNYLYEIANLCLVEIWEEPEKKIFGFGHELKKYCRVHDLFLDLAVYVSKENKCAFDVEEAFQEFPNGGDGWCRILLPKKSIGKDIFKRKSFNPASPRTLSLYQNYIGTDFPANFFLNMRVLRVLDLSNNDITILPHCIGEMKLLKVINLSRTKIREMPRCIRKLSRLRFLDISWCPINELPVWISKLKSLQHINVFMTSDVNMITRVKGIAKLPFLRTLRSGLLQLSMENEELLKLEDVGGMIQLQELAIRVDTELQFKSIQRGILGQLVKMQNLTMVNHTFQISQNGTDGGPDLPLSFPLFPEVLKTMADLEKLQLENFSLTSCLFSFVNLRDLRLLRCHWSTYPQFENMLNLVSLQLEYNGSCTELPKGFGNSGGFPKLRFLLIRDFPRLVEFPELENGAMPHLEIFQLQLCLRVNKLPEGLERLKMLKEINYQLSGTLELRERLKEGGQDWNKIKACNPRVLITHRN